MSRYFIIYKPYEVLSQFTSTEEKKTLKDLFSVPSDIYPVGRLDYDSEGLLLLTNDKNVNHRLLNPLFQHEREYWVQLEGIIDLSAIIQLQNGVQITINGKRYTTKKCRAEMFSDTPAVPERFPPVRFRKNTPTGWIRLVLREGKNRQVRKMTAATGYPTLRLIRRRIENISLEHLQPGEMRELSKDEVYRKLFSGEKD